MPSESVSQNQPRPLFSNSSTKLSAFLACHSSARRRRAREHRLLRDSDAVDDHQQREHVDREGHLRVAREKEGREKRDQRIDDRQRRRGDGDHRAQEEAGRHGQRDEGGARETEDPGAALADRPKHAGRGDVAAHQSHHVVRRQPQLAPIEQRPGPAAASSASDTASGTDHRRRSLPAQRAGACRGKQAEDEQRCARSSSSHGAKPPAAEAALGQGQVGAFEMIADVEQQHVAHGRARGRMNFDSGFAEHRPTHKLHLTPLGDAQARLKAS